ncbi:MAG: hypothetical protein CL610_27000 [Anaerolineaceae bacterium]|nr:hypothetical protein [Anaerolineaceae bacterium]
MKVFRVLALTLVFAAGCSVFPGLRVLTGEDVTGTNAEITQMSEIVMADKTGATDPSLMAAADRIEAASPFVDIIEIRKDEADDAFVVNMLFQQPADSEGQTQAALISLYTAIQRSMELTWQGTLRESEGTSTIRVNFIVPQGIPTLDSGTSFIGVVTVHSEIERVKAINYLSGPRNLNDFLDLIVDGTLSYENPQGGELYVGQPNHPLFMLGSASMTESESS